MAAINSWLRLWHDLPNDPKGRTIARKAGQPIPTVIAVYIHMLICASVATERGSLASWSDEDAGAAMDLDTATVEAVRDAMEGRVIDGGRLAGWQKRQPIREDDSSSRVREFRNSQKKTPPVVTEDVTQCNDRGEERREEEIREELKPLRSEGADVEAIAPLPVKPKPQKQPDVIEEWFRSEFYPIYPRKKASDKALKAARGKLTTPAFRETALRALRLQLPEFSARDPDKIPYPASWINSGCWKDEPENLSRSTTQNGYELFQRYEPPSENE